MKERKSFLFYYDWANIYEPLDDIRKAKLITATIRYAKDNTDTRFDDLTLKVLFNVIKDTIDRDAEKYDIKCKINSDNGKRGGRPKKQNKPNENEKTERLLTKAKKADIDIERDKDIDIDIDIDIDRDKEIEKESTSSSFSSKTVCA